MKIVFMGTPEFAIPVLSALMEAGHDVVGAYTRPDKRQGRGRRLVAPPVKQFALEDGLDVFQPRSLRPPEVQEKLTGLGPDVVVVAAYGLFLPASILDAPPLGCLNVHPSLLPRYRGPSPVSSAILNGDSVTGVTVIRLDEGMDTGPIVAQRETPIGPEEDAEELTARLFKMGGALLVEVLPVWGQGQVQAQPQDDSRATVTRLVTRTDGKIDWSEGATGIARHVRAYRPWPGSFTRWKGKLLKVVQAAAVELPSTTDSTPGRVVPLPENGIGVTTGDGVLEIRRVQLEGRRAVSAREFVAGYPGFVGSALGA